MKYKVGDKVLIKPYKDIRGNPKADSLGDMARDWGGKIMTIKFVESNPYYMCGVYRMEEDYDYSTETKGWLWFEDMIEELATTINVATDDLLDFISS